MTRQTQSDGQAETEEPPTNTSARGQGRTETDSPPATGEPILRTAPTTRPVMVLVALTVGLAVLVSLVVVADPSLVGGGDIANVVLNVVVLLALLVLGRLVLKIWLIKRTTYTITPTSLKREYTLLYRRYEREIPVKQLRGHEFTQSRIEYLLGYGTVRMLTGGTDRSLGFLEFEYIDDPAEVRAALRDVSQHYS